MDKFLMIAGKIGSQRHLAAIRDAFVTIMPIIMAASFGLVIKNFPGLTKLIAVEGAIFNSSVNTWIGNVWWGALAMVTLFLVFSIGYHLSRSYGVDPAIAGLVALASYLSITPQSYGESGWGNLNWLFTRADSMFVGILIAILATELYVRLKRVDAINVKLPDSVPPAISRAFQALFPSIFTIYLVVIIVWFFEQFLFKMDIFNWILTYFAKPVSGVSDSLPSAIIVVLLTTIFWFFGLHGANLIGGVTSPIFSPLALANADAYSAGAAMKDIPHIVHGGFFEVYVWFGGAGATLGLLIAIYIMAKSKQHRAVANVGIAPAIFNINEPVIFGLPIVLNVRYVVPFILGPTVCTVLAYLACAVGLAPKVVLPVVWTTPVLFSGFLYTGNNIMGAVMQLINLAVCIIIYLPFVYMADRADLAVERAEEATQK